MVLYETTAYILRYWFVLAVLILLFGAILSSYGEYRKRKLEEGNFFFAKSSAGILIFIMILFVFSAFVLLSFRGNTVDFDALFLGGGLCVVIAALYLILKKFYPLLDRQAFIIPLFLASVGLILQYRLSPEHGIKQFIWFAAGIVALIIAIEVIRRSNTFGKLNYLFMGLCVAMLLSTLVLSRSIGGAKNWLEFGGFSIQPSEFAKLLFIVISAYYLSQRRTISSILPYIIFCATCLIILVIARDLGSALLFALTFIVLIYCATGKKRYALFSASGLMGGALISYNLFSHVKTRVDIWIDPWAVYQAEGYQIVQALMAIASGGFLGMGLNLGYPSVIPAARTDFIFAVVCEEFGIIFGIAVIAFYVLLIIRGALIALRANTLFHQLLAFGATAMLSLQCFIIIGGVIKLIPLTGITLPFLSYGGSSMVSCMALLGILQGVAVKSEQDQPTYQD